MKRNFILGVYSALTLMLGSSCLDQSDVYNPERVNQIIESSFDFSSMVTCPIEISVGYKTLVTVYAENPQTTSNPKELYATYTDYDGTFIGKMVIPSEYLGKTLYATTFDTCTPAVLTKEGIRFAKAQSRTVSPSSNESLEQMCKRLRDEYIRLLPENTNNTSTIEKLDNVNINITKENTQMTASFVHSGASCGSKLYYYYYKTGTKGEFGSHNQACDIIYDQFKDEKYHIFRDRADNGEIWNAWPDETNTKYYCVGYHQDLLFYGENYDQQGTPNFPAGYTVSFFVKMVSSIANNRPLYSEFWLNSWNDFGNWVHNQRQAAQFKDKESQSIIIGFEDLALRLYENNQYTCDLDYNDIMFAITTDFEKIDDDKIEDLNKDITESKSGTLLYEDLYPSQGDYDMNDVIIEYTYTKHFNQKNILTKIDYEFTPVHDGAFNISDFSLMIDKCVTTPILIFKNHKNAIGQTFTGSITTEVVGKQKDDVTWEDFNPFITIESNNREVHLTKKSPSANANTNGLNDLQLSYISNDKGLSGEYPFAMDIPIKGFKIVTEKQRIDDQYPQYKKWVKSNKQECADWYNHYKEQ